ncbi:phosphoesterase [Thermosipho ferrireducens]|uniref:Phosphoesterase n=1 Tax=Thermosipho ferrireducens TaxID=2571116 RepID=A0ABX7S6Q8_9BACT|nr:DHH family phosphoesterase [Thermosipho ferrireducens]QTA37450.1 phosphoesterase [Thermosipho ferrireducens]
MNFKDLLKFSKGKKILHTTHTFSDCDGIASVFWGLKVFGGDYYIPALELRSAYGLVKKLNLTPEKKLNYKEYDLFFIYDTEKQENVDFLPLEKNKYVIFDHHHGRDSAFLKNAMYVYSQPSSANVVNLYELSIVNEIELSEDILLAFAVGLYTDTAALRTARSNEFYYMSKFLLEKRLEDILDIIYLEPIDKDNFLKLLENIKFFYIKTLSIAVSKFNNQNEYFGFIDGLFNILNLDILIGILPEGIKIHMKKKHIQKVYHRLLIPLQKELRINRDHGIWYNFYDYKSILKTLENYQ